MKISNVAVICFAILGFGCSKHTSNFTSVDLERDPEAMARIEGTSGRGLSTVTTKTGSVEIKVQTVNNIEIDDTFVKSLKDKSGRLERVQAYTEDNKFSKFEILRWSRSQGNKKAVLEKILSSHRDLDNKKIESFNLKLAHVEKGVAPFWYLEFTEANGEIWRKIFDKNLKVVSLERLGCSFDVVESWVYPKGPKLSILQSVQLTDLFKADDLITTNLKVTSETNDKVQVTGSPLQFNLTDNRFDQVQTFYVAQKTLDWFRKNFGIDSGQALDVQVHVGTPEKTNTAFYYSGRIRLGAGDNVTYSKIPWDASIVAHETSHYVIDQLAHLPFQGEGGSLNEAFADYFASVILGNPKLGEAAYLMAPYKRRIDEPKKFSEKKGALYADSLIVSSLLWEIHRQLGEKKGIALAVQTLQGLNPQSQMESFRNELIKQSLQLLSPDEHQKVLSLMREREWKVD